MAPKSQMQLGGCRRRKSADRWQRGSQIVVQAKRLKAIAHANFILNLKSKREPLIPARILKQLADLHLPPNAFVYQACLEKLLRG